MILRTAFALMAFLICKFELFGQCNTYLITRESKLSNSLNPITSNFLLKLEAGKLHKVKKGTIINKEGYKIDSVYKKNTLTNVWIVMSTK
jgi:hypothetical protein